MTKLIGQAAPGLGGDVPAARLRPVTVIYLVALFASLLFIGSLGPPALAAILVLLALDALRGTRTAMRSLVLIYFLRALNPGFVGADHDLMLPGIFALMVCCGRICYDSYKRGARIPAEMRYLTVYLVAVLLTSLTASPYITVSLFKAMFFYLVAASLLLGCSTLADLRTEITEWLINCYAAVVVVSLPLLFHALGYFRDGQGFQGMLRHPQEYAICMAPFAAFLLVQVFRRGGTWALPWLLVVTATLVMTRSRTSILAMAAGAGIAYLVVRGRRGGSGSALRVALLASLLAGAGLVTLYLARDEATAFLQTFLLKGGGEDISEAFEASRGFLIAESISNFMAHPVAGIGFGVNLSEFRVSVPIYEPLTGLPISFPTEKANLVVAVLEESGVFGFTFFLLFIWMYCRGVRQAGRVEVAAMAFAAILTNVGEMTFFSMNSYGLLSWVLLALAVTSRSASVEGAVLGVAGGSPSMASEHPALGTLSERSAPETAPPAGIRSRITTAYRESTST